MIARAVSVVVVIASAARGQAVDALRETQHGL
jgi:hypothetical protein